MPGGAPPSFLPEADPPKRIEGVVERITFHNDENGWSVLRFLPDGYKKPVAAVGSLPAVAVGERLSLSGTWINDPKYGRQFSFAMAQRSLPASIEGLKRFLGSGMIRGLGPKTAERIVERFGEDTVRVMDEDIERLLSIEGIGKKTLEQIREGWTLKRGVQEAVTFLQGHGLTPRMAEKIVRQYGAETVKVVKENPYRLARDLSGIGFRRADIIAREMGFGPDSPERAEAAVLYALNQARDDGHCFYPFDGLKEKAAELLEIEGGLEMADDAVRSLYSNGFVECEKVEEIVAHEATNAVYLPSLHEAEIYVSQKIAELSGAPKLLPKIDPETALKVFEESYKFELSEEQGAAVSMVVKGGVTVLTGGPGTGKTTIVRAILKILEAHGAKCLLAAPTGRAAKRLEESTRHKAGTIHRLLQVDPKTGKFLKNAADPLKCDLLVVDECSMLDIPLASSLLRAVPTTTSVLFVGDVDQLPSVGPGEFLRDLIESGQIMVARLQTIFRQARQSYIIRNAHRVNQGQFPIDPTKPPPVKEGAGEGEEAPPPPQKKSPKKSRKKPDFFLITREKPEEIRRDLVRLMRERIPQSFSMDPMRDVQVLVPMHRNTLGSQELNELLQKELNRANPPQYLRAGMSFGIGDKVIQTKNNYDLDVFNGDIGQIVSIEKGAEKLRVMFEGRQVTYDFKEIDQLQLAYVISIHKSQGSEYSAVVVVVHTQHHVLLQRHLIYTAITRGKRLVVLIGSKRAIAMAVKNLSGRRRHTALAWRLNTLSRPS